VVFGISHAVLQGEVVCYVRMIDCITPLDRFVGALYKSASRAADLRAVIEDLKAEGRASRRRLVTGLTERGIRTPMGRAWTATTVENRLIRI
jgi:hypothetical protein